ncbi:hypothetical protein ES702_05600 [subsurface metagenome]
MEHLQKRITKSQLNIVLTQAKPNSTTKKKQRFCAENYRRPIKNVFHGKLQLITASVSSKHTKYSALKENSRQITPKKITEILAGPLGFEPRISGSAGQRLNPD